MGYIFIHESPRILQFSPQSFFTPSSNGAPLEMLAGDNVEFPVRAFDDTTEEFVRGVFRVPENIDPAGTVKYRIACMAKTAAADKTVCHRIISMPCADNEDFDRVFAGNCQDLFSINATQDRISLHELTQSVSGTLWNASELVLLSYSRYPSVDTLVGDMLLFHLTVEIPIK